MDLKQIAIYNADGPDIRQQDHSLIGNPVSVFFRDHEKILIDQLKKTDFVLGAVAWLTSAPILTALSNVKWGCSILVQKEDFLRPEVRPMSAWKNTLRERYSKLTCCFERFQLPGIASRLSYAGDPSQAPIRCVGNYNIDKNPAMPRMHHKFLIFCDSPDDYDAPLIPKAVWTGSLNLTYNATQSFENSILIEDTAIAEAYANEWGQLMALSEPLDWEYNWVAPEFRIGS